MKWIERFDLFLLDFDGLLVDTENVHYKAFQMLCDRYGYHLPWDFDTYIFSAHQVAGGIRAALYKEFPEIETKYEWESFYGEKKKIYLELAQKEKFTLMPGVEPFLKQLALSRKKRCVVTNSTKEQVEHIKYTLPILKTIPVWFTREDYDQPKPAPDGYFKAIEVLADPGDKMVGFEDSFKGIRSLEQTPALPILICDPHHPQMKESVPGGAQHFPSFQKVSSALKPHI